MERVVILTPDEYDNLKQSENSLVELLNDLERLMNSPKELRDYISNLLDIE